MTLAATTLLPQIALVVFLTIFCTIVLWLWLTPKSRWKKDARIPIDEAPQARDDNAADSIEPTRNAHERRSNHE